MGGRRPAADRSRAAADHLSINKSYSKRSYSCRAFARSPSRLAFKPQASKLGWRWQPVAVDWIEPDEMATIDSVAAGALPSCRRRRLAALCTAVISPTTTRKAAAGTAPVGKERFSLEGKIALITAGAGDLFGSSVTEALAEAGATVIVASRSLERNESYAETMKARGYAGGAKGYAVDISDPESIAELRLSVERDYGRLDILVNNALTRDGHGRDEGQPTQTLTKVQKVAAGAHVLGRNPRRVSTVSGLV